MFGKIKHKFGKIKYNEAMEYGDYFKAIEITEHHNLGEELTKKAAEKFYDEMIEGENYIDAFMIAEDYNLDEDLIDKAAIKGHYFTLERALPEDSKRREYYECMRKGKYRKAMEIAKEGKFDMKEDEIIQDAAIMLKYGDNTN